MCAPCRVTTSEHQPTCRSVSGSVAAVSLCRWSTPPTWWTSRKRPPVSWLFTHRTRSTTGPLMMSSCLPTQPAWLVRHMKHITASCLMFCFPSVCKHVFVSFTFSGVQMYLCNKETYGYFPVPMPSHATLQDEADSFLHTQLEVMGESGAWTGTRITFVCSLVMKESIGVSNRFMRWYFLIFHFSYHHMPFCVFLH